MPLSLTHTLQIPEFSEVESQRCRVLFGALRDFLVIWVPGHYVQLLDCAGYHTPCDWLVLRGSEMVPPLDQLTVTSEEVTARRKAPCFLPCSFYPSPGEDVLSSSYLGWYSLEPVHREEFWMMVVM